jgi:flagellar biosynthetic protein FliR
MPASASLPLSTLYAFLLVLARVAGVATFVPVPGFSTIPEPPRIALALGFTLALAPLWPAVPATPGIGLLAGWIASEAVLGLTIGLVVGFLSEAFQLCGQMVGLQAGYSYASTVDPNTQSDSTVLSVMAQAIASLLFFALGLHREVFRIFARSLETLPPGAFVLKVSTARAVIDLGSQVFSTGLRLALPVMAMLVMVDLALALLGRINSQLQLLTMAFPVKMLMALALLAAVVGLYPRVYRGYASHLFEFLPSVIR